MLLSGEYILYRRVPWRPDNGQWWVKQGDLYVPQPAAVALSTTQNGERRVDEHGRPIPGKEGLRERGLSVNAHGVPSAAHVSYATRCDPKSYRIIGFKVVEVRARGFEVFPDATDPNHEAYVDIDGTNDHHALIVTIQGTTEPAHNLLRRLGRQHLIGISHVVDEGTGELVGRYYPDGYKI